MKRFYAGDSGAPQVKPYVEQEVYDTRRPSHRATTGAPSSAAISIRQNTKALFGALERSGWKLKLHAGETAGSSTTRSART
jgi:hypothetical protein